MKKLFLLFSIFCAMNTLKAQEIVKEGKEWAVVVEDNYTPSDNAYTRILFFEGDTIIDDMLYKVLYSSLEKDKSNTSIVGFFREINGKVYARARGWTSGNISEEGLLYDFSLKKGDTVTIDNKFDGHPSVSLILDTIIENIDESGLIGYCFKEMNYPLPWVDIWYFGVGSYCGLVNVTADLYVGAPIPALLCCKDSTGTLLYQNPKYSTCYYYVGIEDLSKTEQLKINISPNPVSEALIFTAEGKQYTNVVLQLYTAQGQKVNTQQIQLTPQAEVVVKDLPTGIYYYELLQNQKRMQSGKFVKTNKK